MTLVPFSRTMATAVATAMLAVGCADKPNAPLQSEPAAKIAHAGQSEIELTAPVLRIIAGRTFAKITWAVGAHPIAGVRSYTLRWKKPQQATWRNAKTVSKSSLLWRITGLEENTDYVVFLAADPETGYVQSSTTDVFTTTSRQSLTPPTNSFGQSQSGASVVWLEITWGDPPHGEDLIIEGYTVVQVQVSIAPSHLEQDVSVIGPAEFFEVGADVRRYEFTQERDPAENIEYRLAVFARSNDRTIRHDSQYSNLLYVRVLSVSAFEQKSAKPVLPDFAARIL